MQDFMGNNLAVGDYVAAGGSGNGKAEYGMILYRVTAVDPKLKLVRLSVNYPTGSATNVVVDPRKVTSTNPNKYVKVHPPSGIEDLFSRAVEGKLTRDEATLVGRWVHGAEHQVGLFK